MKAFFKCLFICLSLYAELQAQSPKPNILILFTDDHTYHAVGALGNKVVKTPHMDELVKNGTTFSQGKLFGWKTRRFMRGEPGWNHDWPLPQ